VAYQIPKYADASLDTKIALAGARNSLEARRDVKAPLKRKRIAGGKIAAGVGLAGAGAAGLAYDSKAKKQNVSKGEKTNRSAAIASGAVIGGGGALYAGEAKTNARLSARSFNRAKDYKNLADNYELSDDLKRINAQNKNNKFAGKPYTTATQRKKFRAYSLESQKEGKRLMRVAGKKGAIGATGLAIGGASIYSGAKGSNVKKAYRRFDPEADRQRRAGLYTGVGVLGAGLAGREAATKFTTKANVNGTKVRGIVAKPGKGKAGLGLAALAAASGAFGASSYKGGLSTRNQPWT
jgi:hypothetical protein